MSIQEESIDIETSTKELEEKVSQLTENKKQYESVLNNVEEIVFQVNKNGLLIYLNRTWTEMTGYSLEESIGTLFSNFIHSEDRKLILENFTYLVRREKEYCRFKVRYMTKDRGFKWAEVFSRLTLDEAGNITGVSGTLSDNIEKNLIEQQLRTHEEHLVELVADKTRRLNDINEELLYLTTHDLLTHVYNRSFLEDALNEAIIKGKNKNIPSALLLIDLDNFRFINDTYGHSVGDEVLIKVLEPMRKYLSNGNIIARLGGDEFAILLNETAIESAVNSAELLRQRIERVDIELTSEITINITISIGIVEIDAMLTPQKILSYADTALYSAKESGKNRVTVIESSDDKTRLSEFNKTVELIKKAIKDNRFILFYQPIIKVRGQILHYEALIRMFDEKDAIIPPNIFIPVAERFGLMSQIDRWVVRNVIRTLEKNQYISVFINLSGHSLGDRALLSFIEESIRNSKIEPAHLGFEITETSAIRDLSQSEKWIKRIKQLGCKFALDDFGVGFSSFSYLSNLPVDYLKIDGSFVKSLDKDPTQKALIQAMNAVAHALGKQTIAEFVESRDILSILQDLNVDCGQGYYIGRPQPLEYIGY